MNDGFAGDGSIRTEVEIGAIRIVVSLRGSHDLPSEATPSIVWAESGMLPQLPTKLRRTVCKTTSIFKYG